MVREDEQNNWTTQPTYDALLIRYLPQLLGKESLLRESQTKGPTQTQTHTQEKAKPEQAETQTKTHQTHTLHKCSCGALLTKTKIAKHLRSDFHLNALSKKTKPVLTQREANTEPLPTPTASTAELDQLSNKIQRETALILDKILGKQL